MGNTAGQGADGLQFLSLNKLLFKAFVLGDVSGHADNSGYPLSLKVGLLFYLQHDPLSIFVKNFYPIWGTFLSGFQGPFGVNNCLLINRIIGERVGIMQILPLLN